MWIYNSKRHPANFIFGNSAKIKDTTLVGKMPTNFECISQST